MSENKAYIKGISYYLPERVLSNTELVQSAPEWNASKIYEKLGIRSRCVASSSETAGDLAEQAALKLFQEYGISPKEIDFILLCTQSPDYFLPSTACVLQRKLGIQKSAGALDYNLGCSGCVYGFALAKGLIAGGIAKNVLLLTAETYQKYIHPDDISNKSIFGDGAAACLISTSGFAEIGAFELGSDGGGAEHLIVKTGASREKLPNGKKHVDADGHVQYDDYLYMNGSEIFSFSLKLMPQLIGNVLKKNGMIADDVDYYVFHQANKFMIDKIRKSCKLSEEKVYLNIENVGNTVSSTILIALKDCIESSRIKPKMNVLVAGFGVGLSWGGSVLKF